MKATLANLNKALKACAKAHNVQYKWWREDGQMTLHGDTVPVIADVQLIVKAFYGNYQGIVEVDWGYTNVWLDSSMDSDHDVDEALMYLALPYGTKIKS